MLRSCISFRTGSALVLLYGTTNTMEHHHFNHAVMILSSEVNRNNANCMHSVMIQHKNEGPIPCHLNVHIQIIVKVMILVPSQEE